MNTVALVGRPNVGKSALFNRLTETRRAIVEDFEGVTRDRLYERTEWNQRTFTVVDTGGIWFDDTSSILTMTRQQTEIAINEADIIVWVVDGLVGPTGGDDAVAEILRRTHKPIIIAANKAESPKVLGSEFYEYGLGDLVTVSAMHGEGIGDLLDMIVDKLPAEDDLVGENDHIRLALAGRPNVGKSSLLNALSGEERTLVTPIAGTTRDVVDSLVQYGGQNFLVLDTAGLRRPDKITDPLEEKTVQRTLQAIRNADVVLLMIAADEPITNQDQRIAGQVYQSNKACVVLINKADLVKGTTIPIQTQLQEDLKFLPFAKLLPVSVKTGWHFDRLWPLIIDAYASFTTRISTHILNQIIIEAVHLNPPPTDHGHGLKIYYSTQVDVKPPHFVLFVNDPELVHFSYERYLENRIRERFSFDGSPIKISFRARKRRDLKE